MPWEPIAQPRLGYRSTKLADISIGGTFWYKGEFWRKFLRGVRRQVGRAPKKLTQLPDDTEVFVRA